MPYDAEFFAMYAKYLVEPTVRKNHDMVFRLFRSHTGGPGDVVDLGCGMGEYGRYGDYDRYIGVDKEDHGQVDALIQADYTDLDALAERLPFAPTSFVSLFSMELCIPCGKRYALYEQLFRRFPSARHMLVVGFEYASKAGQTIVGETGGIQSYQAVEGLYDGDLVSDVFSEFRILTRTPSAMFGPDVVEVWKVFSRR